MDTPNEEFPRPVATMPAPVPPRRKTSGLTIFLIIVGCLVVIIGVFGLIIKSSLSELNTSLGVGGSSENLTTVSVLKGAETEGKVALITLTGAIRGDGSEIKGEGTLFDVSRRFRAAAKDKDVKAVLFQVDSPGGGLTASDVIHNEVKKCQAAGKPVVVWIGSLAASGGLYVSAPADWIVASPTSLVGSIGVIMQHMMIKELMEKIGVKVEPIKSTGMKDIGSPFRDMTPEERQYFEELIHTFHEMFVNVVVTGRKMDPAKVRDLASGKIYTAQQSLEYGLIDQIGYFDDAMTKIKELTGLTNPSLIAYKEPFDFEAMLKKSPFGGSAQGENWMKNAIQTTMDLAASPAVDAIWSVK